MMHLLVWHGAWKGTCQCSAWVVGPSVARRAVLLQLKDYGDSLWELNPGPITCHSLRILARLGIEPRPSGYVPGALPLS